MGKSIREYDCDDFVFLGKGDHLASRFLLLLLPSLFLLFLLLLLPASVFLFFLFLERLFSRALCLFFFPFSCLSNDGLGLARAAGSVPSRITCWLAAPSFLVL